jgi:CHAT domain-containing protein
LIDFAVYSPFDPKAKGANDSDGPRYVAYVLRRQGEVQWKELGTAKELDTAVDALCQALRDPQRKDVRQLARAVDEKLMRPLRALAGETRRLLISPDGLLNLLPFAALVDERGHYLIESYAITYLTSGRDLLRLQVARRSQSPPVVVADPEFGAPPLIAASKEADNTRPAAGNRARFDYSQIFFGPLPGVSEEVRALRGLLPNASFLTKERATKTAVQGLAAPSILHIATHGFFLPDQPQAKDDRRSTSRQDDARLGKFAAHAANPLLRSGLALAGANQSGDARDNGILTALEASGLNLWGTKLVVLSACDTGTGVVRNGEGVYGLRRALVLAGAESQLMSLWPVSDRSTRDLMVGFYKELVQGRGRGDALRTVQLQMLHGKAHTHPYYWASFIQTGEWANLEGKR